MADELNPEMLEEATPDLLTLEDEDGQECTFEVIDVTEVNGTRYMAVIPYQEDPASLQEDAELILMRVAPMPTANIWTLWTMMRNCSPLARCSRSACARCSTSTIPNWNPEFAPMAPCVVRFVVA